MSVKWVRQATTEVGDEWVPLGSTRDNVELEDDSGDQMVNLTWTWLIGSRATNELRAGDVRQSIFTGGLPFFDKDLTLEWERRSARAPSSPLRSCSIREKTVRR